MSNQLTGRLGEKLAKKFLKSLGYKIIGANYRTRSGEIDLIAQAGEILIFVEVKARTSNAFGYPEEAVNFAKQQHLSRCIESYFLENKIANPDFRVDVISIELPPNTAPKITHLKNVVF